MDNGSPTLGVGFAIDPEGSFATLRQLEAAMDTTEAKIVAEAAKIEKATGGMINLANGTAQVTSFGNAASRELANVARDTNRAEKAGEAMVRQMNRQIETFGKSSSEIRAMRAELRATEADSRGLTELASRLRAASVEMDRLEASSHGVERTSKRSGFAMQQMALQMPDIIQGLLTGQQPMTVFIQQGGQIAQVAQMAQGGVRGFAAELGMLALRFAPIGIAIATATAGLGLFVRWVNEGVTNNQLTKDLGDITGGADATKEELWKLRDESITWGDTMSALFSTVGKDIAESFVGDIGAMSKQIKALLDDLTGYAKMALAGVYAGVAGTRAYLAEIEKGGIAGIGKMLIGQGDPELLKKTYGAAYDVADQYLTKLGGRVKKAAIENARERLADKIGFNAVPKEKIDRHAESLARAAAAAEAQIRNLYSLADAYQVSGAAALIAEARVKAESDAIKQRSDIDAAVERQIRLAIAQRVADAAKGTAAMRDQVDAQDAVNKMVAGGLAPAERAAELVRGRIADLPLLAAIEAAQQSGLADAVAKSTRQLLAQQKVREDLRRAEATAKYQASMFTGDDRLAELREELRLVGATEDVRVRALATIRAMQEAQRGNFNPEEAANHVKMQVAIAVETFKLAAAQRAYNDSLTFAADQWDLIARNVNDAARGMAESFGKVGQSIGDMASIYADYHATAARLESERSARIKDAGDDQAQIDRANARFAIATATSQIGLYGDMTASAKGFFKEGSDGYKALETAEKAFRAVEFALSVRAMAQDAIETATSIARSGARTATKAVEAVVSAISSLPFPLNLAAGAATIAALASIGVAVAGSFGGSKNTLEKANDGSGTVLGDASAKSDSIKRAIDSLKEVDTLMLGTSRSMLASLQSIESQIGGFAALLVRSGDINASDGVSQGFKPNAIGSILGSVPLVGGILKGLFGTKTKVVGSGLFGGAQSLEDILGGGFDASYYSDIQKKKKFFGLTTSTKYSTQYGAADPELENQFTLILRQFNDAILAASGPLGVATQEIQNRLNGFVVDIGKIDLQGLTGEQIEEKLSAVFGAAADDMAKAAFPGIERFQTVGEGLFETLVRVASTVESVTASLTMLGSSASLMSVDMKVALASQFESVSDFTSAIDSYFDTYYTKAEQAAARTDQFADVFGRLGLSMPSTLAGFRSLVEAQDLTTAAGQATYATLLQLAPAFAELQASMNGAKSAADILSERQDLERQLLEVQGDTAAIRALDLAQLDQSNRALQEQIWALQDAKDAADAAQQLKDAWASVGDSIMDEVNRIRGISDGSGTGSFATLMGQFNAAASAAKGGDQDAASSLPGLSQALLQAAQLAATSRQELDRVKAQTAATLESVYAAIMAANGNGTGVATGAGAPTGTILSAAATAAQVSTGSIEANDNMAAEIKALREEVAQMRLDNNSGHAATASNTGAIKRKLDDVTADAGGNAITVTAAA